VDAFYAWENPIVVGAKPYDSNQWLFGNPAAAANPGTRTANERKFTPMGCHEKLLAGGRSKWGRAGLYPGLHVAEQRTCQANARWQKIRHQAPN
jgi:hypothetical protein